MKNPIDYLKKCVNRVSSIKSEISSKQQEIDNCKKQLDEIKFEKDSSNFKWYDVKNKANFNEEIKAEKKSLKAKISKLEKEIKGLEKQKEVETDKRNKLFLLVGIVAFVIICTIAITVGSINEKNHPESLTTTEFIETTSITETSKSNYNQTKKKITNSNIDTTNKAAKTAKEFNIGDEIVIGNTKFNIYKIDDYNNQLYLLSQKNIGSTKFSKDNRNYNEEHDYKGSLVETQVNVFVDNLKKQGYKIVKYGIPDYEDIYELNFEHSETLSGLPYLGIKAPDFIKFEDDYWLDGYCKYSSYAWTYNDGTIDTDKCEEKHGIRPMIVIEPSFIK